MGRRRIKSPYQNEESFEGNKEEERAHLDRNVSGRGNPTRLVYDANGFLTFLVEDPEWGDRAGDDWVEVRRSGRLIGRKASTKDIYVHRLVWIGVKGSQMICADPKRMNIAIGCVRVSKGDEVTKSDWKGRGRPSTNDAVSISVNLRSGLTEDHRGCFEKESPSIPKGGSGDVDPCDLVNRAMTCVTIMRQTTQYKSVKLRTYSTAKTEETNNGLHPMRDSEHKYFFETPLNGIVTETRTDDVSRTVPLTFWGRTKIPALRSDERWSLQRPNPKSQLVTKLYSNPTPIAKIEEVIDNEIIAGYTGEELGGELRG
ncbi:hypothetical protein BD410DRAFT_807505 [Rickenella mellea]|uniref:Uncharacterized protein n=1 Tax=Rickenella mellea TaxID=50990 RepID=A0A4Y7PP65_9AGAM|nr:hypothetical protein BD410DRAFT_807505 [Rickenella mellea]